MSESSNSRRLLGPFNRVEGDLEVEVEVEQGRISKAWVNSPLFRGFEAILHNKAPMDALVYTPRICGICSVSQSVAAAQAIAQVQNIQPTPNGQLATNLILAAENMADHLSHFYLFFMPDFARDCYSEHAWFNNVQQRFKAQVGSAAREVLPARAQLLHITGVLAGKWPHSLAIQPGGTSCPVAVQEKIRLASIIGGFRQFLEDVVFDDSLENIAALHDSDSLKAWEASHPSADFACFLQVANDLNLSSLGQAYDNFMSFGAYQNNDTHLFQSGIWQPNKGNGNSELNTQLIKEDISHSWLKGHSQHPFQGTTEPDANEDSGYSWCKAPRLEQQVMEVGAIARQMINHHPLIEDLVKNNGANVHSRIVARLLELALVVPEMEQWARQLEPKESFCITANMPNEGQGVGLVEAARGSLGHWLKVKDGRIDNYQIIAPTTWNFSPRDNNDQAGALEMALQNTCVDDDKVSATIQHIIRSFDPCMVCTVH